MKIGNLEVRRAVNKVSKKPEVGELGATGTASFFGSLETEEYNSDLRGSKGRAIYDKMRRSDGQVKATLLVCQLPLLSASWDIEPASDDKQDVEIAEALKDNLFSGMTSTWDDVLRHILLMLPFGFSCFEKVWEVRDGAIRWRKLAPRLPKSLYKWDIDGNGGLQGIEQAAFKGNNYEFIKIPVEKLIVFTNEKEGSNYEGTSILRAAYKHWYYKDNLYRIDGISAERHALGVPVYTYPEGITKSQKTEIDKILQHLNAHEQAYIRHPSDHTFDIKGLSGQIKNILPSVEHHDKMIARSILAQFINLGASNAGSYALARDQSSFFLMALGAVGKNICNTFNRYAIQQWVDYNYTVDKYPTLTVSGLETREIEKYAKGITDLINVGALTPDEGLETALRGMFKLPKKLEPVKQGETITLSSKRRGLTPAEGFVAFGEITKELNSGEDKFVTATKKIMAKQIDNLVDVASKVIQNKQLDKVEDIEVRYRTQLASDMAGVLQDMFSYGRRQVKQELGKQKTKLAEGDITPLGGAELALIQQLMKARAKSSATTMANKLKTFVTFEALRQIRKGQLEAELLREGLKELSDKELKKVARYSVGEAFNYGRSVQAKREENNIKSVQYSAIMDENTCSSCEALDGEEWDYGDGRTDYYAGGNPDCLGGTQCRCTLIYITR